jgi:dihydropyrimidine dehydrogenase (NAD+) subunit PreA
MADLYVDFCGKRMVNPFVIAASPSSDGREKEERALEAGWGGIVFKTVSVEKRRPKLAEPNMGALDYGNKKQMAFYNYDLISERSIEEVCDDIVYLKERFPDRILIGSIMAGNMEEWKYLTEKLEEAGADMIECSMSCPQGDEKGKIPAADEELLEKTVSAIKGFIRKSTPLIVKMTPNVTDIAALARAAKRGGADSICAIDTVRSFIGIDIETGMPKLNVEGKASLGGLSGPAIKPIALGCVAAINQAVDIPVAGVGGISNYEDAAEFILLGCGMVQVCTAVSRLGFCMVKDMIKGMKAYMERMGYEKIEDFLGKSLHCIVNQEELEKEKKFILKIDKKRCIRCGRCKTACNDCGYGALFQNEEGYPDIDHTVCKGCGVCRTVCSKNCIEIFKEM